MDTNTHNRMQGQDEQLAQALTARTDNMNMPVLQRTAFTKKEILDKINQNKIKYYTDKERIDKENAFRLPETHEMRHKDTLFKDIQNTPDEVFKTQHNLKQLRFGKAQEEENIARKKQYFKIPLKKQNDYAIKKANDPAPKEENELLKTLQKKGKIIKNILNQKNLPLKKKFELFKKFTKELKLKNITFKMEKPNQLKYQKNVLKQTPKKEAQKIKFLLDKGRGL